MSLLDCKKCYVAISQDDRSNYQKWVHWINSILKFNFSNILDDNDINYDIDSMDQYHYDDMLNNIDNFGLDLLNMPYDELMATKKSYEEVAGEIPLHHVTVDSLFNHLF